MFNLYQSLQPINFNALPQIELQYANLNNHSIRDTD